MGIGRHIGQKVVVMGMSTGAALGVWSAAQVPASIAALILISPNFGLRTCLARLLPYRWGRLLLRPLSGRIRSWHPLNSRHSYYWTTRYPVGALFPVGHLIAQMRHLNPADICPPVLVIVSPRDRINLLSICVQMILKRPVGNLSVCWLVVLPISPHCRAKRAPGFERRTFAYLSVIPVEQSPQSA